MTSMVFERCRAKQIRLNPVKIELKKASMPYIGHVLTSEGVQAEPGKVKAILEMMLANTLSRHHLEHTTDNTQGDEQVDSLETISEILLCESTVTTLRDHALHDEELQQVQSFIQSGWPASPKDLEPTISPQLSHTRRISNPRWHHFPGRLHRKSLRRQMPRDLHAAHQGIASTTRRARETVYWPHLNQELKDRIAGCPTCDQYHDKQPKEPLIPHEVLNRAWASLNSKINHTLLRSITTQTFSKLTVWTAKHHRLL